MIKLKSIILMCCIGLFNVAYASSLHLHPTAETNQTKDLNKGIKSAGYCEIEIINQSLDDVRVTGTFDDGMVLTPFYVYSRDLPQYISLYYYGRCHGDMYISIYSLTGYVTNIYSAYTPVGSTIRLLPYLSNQIKASVSVK